MVVQDDMVLSLRLNMLAQIQNSHSTLCRASKVMSRWLHHRFLFAISFQPFELILILLTQELAGIYTKEITGKSTGRPDGISRVCRFSPFSMLLPVMCPLLITAGHCAKFGYEGLEDLTDL